MANQYYDVRVNINKTDVIDSGLRFTQGDSNVIFLRIAVMNGDSKFDASDTTPSVNFVKPDGTYVVGTPVASGDVWVYQFLGNEIQAAGKVLCDIKFTYSSGRISSGKFVFFVEKDTTIPEAQASQSYVLPMEEALAEMENYKNQGMTMAESAELYANESEAWAIGKRGGNDVDPTDEAYHNNSKYYAEQAEISAESAAAIVGIGIATTSTAGIVKPDGTTITVANDGTITAVGGGTEQIQSDWNQTDNTKKDYIKNKPTIPAAQIQSDWNQSDNTKADFVKNKPTIPTVNDATLTINQNGTSKGTFSANASSAASVDILTDDWVAVGSPSGGSVTFSGIDDSGNHNYAYKVYFDIDGNSTEKNPTAQISSLSGVGTNNMSITYSTNADSGTNTAHLRRIK